MVECLSNEKKNKDVFGSNDVCAIKTSRSLEFMLFFTENYTTITQSKKFTENVKLSKTVSELLSPN